MTTATPSRGGRPPIGGAPTGDGKITWTPGPGQVDALKQWAQEDGLNGAQARRAAIREGLDTLRRTLTPEEIQAARARSHSKVKPRPKYDKFRPEPGQLEALDELAGELELSRNRVLELVMDKALRRRRGQRSRRKASEVSGVA